MKTSLRLAALLAVAALLPAAARAQESAPPMPTDPRAPRFAEVERGFFTGFEVGYLSLFKTPVADCSKFPFTRDASGACAGGGRAGGLAIGLTAGYDVTRRLAVALYALAGNASASPSYGGFDVVSAGGDVRAGLLGFSDKYGVERLQIYLHGRAGLLFTRPTGLLGDRDVWVSGGPGLEYYTRLRHFSVGLAVDGAYLTKAKAAGLTVTPTVRYTF